MPPFIPAKRELSTPPSSNKKLSLFDAADTPSASKRTLQDNKTFLEELDHSADDASLSDVSSQEFEDAFPPSPKRRRINKKDEEEDDEVDWEDAIEHTRTPFSEASAGISGDLELTLNESVHTVRSSTNPHEKKKGPSKIEREIRISTHRMHVQFLLFHSFVRSRWASDSEVQKILVDQLPEQIRIQVDKWRIDSGLNPGSMISTLRASTPRGKKGRKRKAQNERNQRDWGKPAERQHKGEPNMSAGDPIIRLLKFLSAYWKKKFTITAPGLRKQGYRSLPVLEEDIVSFRKDRHDPEAHGEYVDGVEGFRNAARLCKGSRDVGAQLFAALLRGLGVEARLIASLQPIGFGWSKNEDASIKKENGFRTPNKVNNSEPTSSSEDSSDGIENIAKKGPKNSRAKWPNKFTNERRKPKGAKDAPIYLSEDTEVVSIEQTDDDGSVIDVTPDIPRGEPNTQYDRDLPAPTYWIEAISPITYHVYPVDPLVSKIPVITSSEYLAQFEPRGTRAEKAKQVIAYVIAYSSDGSAKDVTTRYLKRHVWPGRTKGVRLPAEKVPVYNKTGKIKKYEEYDWFKTVMSGYEKPHFKRTAVDDLEEEKDLKPAKHEKKETSVREDTLQFYKASADFVLERHLRREEAIKPASKPVRTFVSGKGEDTKEEPVYRRQDIEVCRTGESWHKEGRAVKPGEQPMKMVPIRAVTLTRKREVEEAERDSGEKQKQGLYARNQTDWIIPPPIENGRIPKNAYGNIDCFVPTMVPNGAVHIPLRKTVMICKKLGIDYAEAVTGFEFGNKMAVPVIEGVVVAKAHKDLVIDRWEKDEEERKIKEEGKREKMALGTWRKWLMGLRIIQRVKEEYGGDADAHMKEEMNPFTNQSKGRRKHVKHAPRGNEEAQPAVSDGEEMSGGFVVDDEEDIGGGGGFLVKGSHEEEAAPSYSELVMEETEQVAQPSRRGLAVLAVNAHGRQCDTRTCGSGLSVGEEESVVPPAPPKPTIKCNVRKKATPRAGSNIQKASKNGNKPKGSPPSDDFNTEPVRPIPKRKAARKSEIAVQSHYFDNESDEGEGVSSDDEEEFRIKDIAEGVSRRKPRRRARSTKRSARARKSA